MKLYEDSNRAPALLDSGQSFAESRSVDMANKRQLTPGIIRLLAQEFADQVQFKPEESITPLLRKLRIRLLVEEDIPPGTAIVRHREQGSLRGMRIALPSRSSVDEDRFAVAQVLGMELLRVFENGEDTTQASKRNGDRRALWFAISFLMPRHNFISRYHEKRGDTKALSSLFNVPPHIVEYRAKELGVGGSPHGDHPA